MQHLHSTKSKDETPASGEVITLPPVQVRRRAPTFTRRMNDLLQRVIPALLGLGVLVLATGRDQQQRVPDAAQHAGFRINALR